ncbi:glycerol-3-phosphate 1-O-acyltransferase PlsY [Sandaracinus amylolyticus]|uniref:glycerol-3-phosphate 1-O-acyltransferase PlsY n=1 Tax=Sandaracinus amylolyticus TaxID=927083 RepID=UPI001F03004C|nr:glycerol-3-phosphate 1-O-acyltransferase PlsY [Sandaracinus amylolyticus]UJR81828.1 Acyl-phosphate glycerol-3-phosphate acyltransferase [Sandaracinus amylolyticus]
MPPSWIGPALAIIAYLVGSISFALLIARRKGIDLYGEGSGNPGATNVGRVIGKKEGRVVLLLDALKGALPYGAALLVLGRDDVWTAVCGVAAVVGHCLPVWHRFRGGKGAATAAGVMLVAQPIAGIAAVAGYLVLKRITRRASVGSLVGAVIGAAIVVALEGARSMVGMMTIAIAIVVWLRHADNLVRLARGEEPPS